MLLKFQPYFNAQEKNNTFSGTINILSKINNATPNISVIYVAIGSLDSTMIEGKVTVAGSVGRAVSFNTNGTRLYINYRNANGSKNTVSFTSISITESSSIRIL